MLIGDFSDTTIQQANKKFDSAGRNGFVAFLGILTVVAFLGILTVVASLLTTALAVAVRWMVRRRKHPPTDTRQPFTDISTTS